MKVQYLSDIHLEFFHIQKVIRIAKNIQPVCEILILAGDIGSPSNLDNHYRIFLEIIAPKFKKIFIIAGNHEYYGNLHSILEIKTKIAEICADFSNITFLDNSSHEYKGFLWIGSTLWTNISENNKKTINDIVYISNFTTADYNKTHQIAVEYIEKTLVEPFLPCIVITHHLPIHDLIHSKFSDSDINEWFAARLDNILIKYSQNIKGWFYGHTHQSSFQTHYSVRFYCNPIGYSGENVDIDYKRYAILESG